MQIIKFLKEKSLEVRKETLNLHKLLPEMRIASCLSAVEILVVLYYGKILNFNPKDTNWKNKDRFIVSKGHGALSLYYVLADLGFFKKEELKKVGKENSIFGSIPDCRVPGFETINGSLGHGIGVGCGIALALKKKKLDANVFVLSGDGELYEGAVWEAIMFAGHRHLDNLLVIVDNNKICMLDYCKNIIDLEPLDKKFSAFNWKTKIVDDGHNIEKLYYALINLKKDKSKRPKILIANTIKGKGVQQLENDTLCHVKSLKDYEIDNIIKEIDSG